MNLTRNEEPPVSDRRSELLCTEVSGELLSEIFEIVTETVNCHHSSGLALIPDLVAASVPSRYCGDQNGATQVGSGYTLSFSGCSRLSMIREESLAGPEGVEPSAFPAISYRVSLFRYYAET